MQVDRFAREKAFHDERYADDSARQVRTSRYYSAIRYGFELYRRRVLDESRARSVLEYGCGTGDFALELASVAARVTGIDISEVAIERAGERAAGRELRNIEFLVQNAEAMSLPEKYVDVIAGVGIIHHLDITKAMEEIKRVLSDGGIAIFAEPLAHNPVLNWYRNRTPQLRTTDEHPLTHRDLRRLAQEFRDCTVTYFGLVAPALGLIQSDSAEPGSLTKFLWWIDKVLCTVPWLNRYAWYCIIELKR